MLVLFYAFALTCSVLSNTIMYLEQNFDNLWVRAAGCVAEIMIFIISLEFFGFVGFLAAFCGVWMIAFVTLGILVWLRPEQNN